VANVRTSWKLAVAQTGLHVFLLVTAFAFAPMSRDRWILGLLIGWLMVIGSLPLTIKRIRAVSRSAMPILDAALAVLMMVALLIIGFATMYMALSKHDQEITGIKTKIDAVYYTVTTLATVGYGDITPTGQLARGIATIQMILDILVVGVAARLAMQVANREAASRRT
jgi:voltage-gated potassium channel